MGSIPAIYAVPAAELTIMNNVAQLAKGLAVENHYGSPQPPWQPGSKPGWYYGPNPGKAPGIPCLTPVSFGCMRWIYWT